MHSMRAATATLTMWTVNDLLFHLLALNLHLGIIVSAWTNHDIFPLQSRRPISRRIIAIETSSSSSSTTTRLASTNKASTSSSSTTATNATFTLPHLELAHIQHLAKHGYVVIPDFISEDFQAALREDLRHLRSHRYFKDPSVGHDQIDFFLKQYAPAVCSLPSLPSKTKTKARQQLFQLLQQLLRDLLAHANVLSHDTAKTRDIPTRQLDTSTTISCFSWHQYLYAYYPQGAFSRRHVDEEPGSSGNFGCYSLLLYLNDNEIWKSPNYNCGGQLRLHLDSRGDYLPDGEEPNYITVEPYGGTLVIFSTRDIPHEVLETNLERLAVVGFYNRPMSPTEMYAAAAGIIGQLPVYIQQALGELAVLAFLIMVMGMYRLILM